MLASVNFGAQSVRSGHLLLAILADKRLRVGLFKSAPQLERINVEQLRDEFNRRVDGSPEVASETAAGACAGEIDPVTARDDEIRQIIDILMRRRQNNPILTGEAGITILDDAIRAAVSLSHRYIPARQLPDKAVVLLDTIVRQTRPAIY